MKKIKNLWKKLWETLWENCEFAVNKLVDKWKMDKNSAFGMWNTAGFGGIKTDFGGFVAFAGGKIEQINKLYNSEVSTIST